MLTARDAVADRVAGLEAGADDYLVKPFAIEELVARLHALGRRGRDDGDRLAYGDLVLELEHAHRPARRAAGVAHGARERRCSSCCCATRAWSCRASGRSRRSGREAAVPNVVDRYVARLRRKLGDPPLIHTVRGVGFMLRSMRPRTLQRPPDRGRRAGGRARRRLRSRCARGCSWPSSCTPRSTAACASARRTSRASASRRRPLLTAPGALEAPVAGRQLSVEVLDRHGRFVARSLALGARLLPDTQVRLATRCVAGTAASPTSRSAASRCASTPRRSPDDGGPAAGGAVLVASSTTDIDADAAAGCACCSCSPAVLAAGVRRRSLLRSLTRRGLRPARAPVVGRRARSSAPATRRAACPTRDAADEVGELTRTLNRMLAALDAARLRERRFLADATHELRTPVTSLAGNVEFVVASRRQPRGPRRPASSTPGACSAWSTTCSRSSARAPARRPIAPSASTCSWRRRWPGRPRARVGAREPGHGSGEPDALRRALDNLLDNAEVHGPRGRRGHGLGHDVPARRAALVGARRGPRARPAEPEHVFERFWRGPARGGPPGLGPRPRDRARDRPAPRRRVTVDGSTFTLRLPASVAARAGDGGVMQR